MTDGGIKTITVNDLASILGKHYNVRAVNIKGVEVADIITQHHPEAKEVGIGGVLNLQFTYLKKEEPETRLFVDVCCPLSRHFCRKDCINCVEHKTYYFCRHFERVIEEKELIDK
jgi:hypothetical protein